MMCMAKTIIRRVRLVAMYCVSTAALKWRTIGLFAGREYGTISGYDWRVRATGVILWAEIRLKPIVNPYIDMESIQFSSLSEFVQISAETDKKYEYSMSWVDILIGGDGLCRGLFMCGNNDQSRKGPNSSWGKSCH